MVQPTLLRIAAVSDQRAGPPSPSIPTAGECRVWIDFDGTISSKDVLDEVIRRCAIDNSWKDVELAWQRGEIGSRECLSRQFDVIRAGEAEINQILSGIGVDPGFLDLLALLKRQHVPVAVLSDGADLFIQRLLALANVTDLPVRSNALKRDGDRLSLSFPHGSTACESASAHCKCASMLQLSNLRGVEESALRAKSIYIGDGRSDVCAARKCEVAFAKSTLANVLAAERKPFWRYSTLSDVVAILSEAWQAK